MQLNFLQKRVGVITLLLVGVTLAVALIVFTGEWSRTFWLEFFALLFAVLLFGMAHMHVLGQDDSILPYVAVLGPLSVGYLAFVLLMSVPVLCEMRFRYFALIHLVGLVVFFIAWIVHGMGSHAIGEQGKRDNAALATKKNFYLDMTEVMANARVVFANDKDIVARGERLTDTLRYAATSKAGLEASDRKVADAIAAVSATLDTRDIISFNTALQSLGIAYRMREECARML